MRSYELQVCKLLPDNRDLQSEYIEQAIRVHSTGNQSTFNRQSEYIQQTSEKNEQAIRVH